MPTPIGPETTWFCPTLNPTQTGLPDELLHGYSCVSNCIAGGATWTADTDNGGAWSFINNAVAGYEFHEVLGSPAATNSTGISIWVKFEATDVQSGNSSADIYRATNGSDSFLVKAQFFDTGFSQSFKMDFQLIGGGGSAGSLSNLSLSNQDTEAAWDAHFTGWHHFFLEASWKRPYDAGTAGDFDPLTNASPYWKVYLDGEYLGPSNSNPMYNVSSSGSFGAALGADNYTYPTTVDGGVGTTYTWDDCRLFANTMPTDAEVLTLASARGVEGSASTPPVGLGDEQLWLCPTLDNAAPFNDLSDQGNNGTAVGGLSTVADTSAGGAYCYDITGSGVYVQTTLTDTSWRPSGSDTFTVSGWFKASSRISNSGVFGDGSVFLYKISNVNRATVIFDHGGADVTFTKTGYPNSGFVWRHLLLVSEGGVVSAYEDGVFQGTNSARAGRPVNAQLWDARVGDSTDACRLDDIRVYDRVLTQSEISWLATERGVLGTPPEGLGDEYGWWCPSLDANADGLTNLAGGADATLKLAGQFGVVSDTGSGGTKAWEGTGLSNSGINTGVVPLADNDFSMSCWFKQDAGASGFQEIMAVEDPSTRDYLQCRVSNGAMATDFNVLTMSEPTDLRGGWHHVVVTLDYSGNAASQYIDGVLVNSGTMSNGWSQNLGEWEIGSQGRSGINVWDGLLDDSRIYNRVLTQTEITHLASQRGVTGKPPVGLGDEQLWWSPSLSQSVTLDSSAYGKTVSKAGTAPTLVADTDAGGQYAGQIPNNGAVRVEDPVQFMTTGDCSAAGWIKASSSATLTMIGQQAGGLAWTKSGVTVDQYSGQNRAKFFDGINNDEILLQGGNTIPANTWYHVAATKEGSTCKLFVNGVLLASGTQIGIPSNPDYKDLLIGGAWNGSTSFYGDGGYIDDVRLYNRALTQAEITHLAEARGIQGSPPQGLGGEKLWLCPSINNSPNDISGYGNNGVYQNGMGTIASSGAGGSFAYDFDGTDDYIDCGNILGGTIGGNDTSVTYTSWMKLDSYSNNNNGWGTAWMGKCDAVSRGGYVLGNINGVIGFYRYPNNSTGAQYLGTDSSVSQIPLSTWKHVAVTYSGCETTGCTSVYIDGVAVSVTETENSYGTGMGENTDTFKIGTTLRLLTYKRMMNGQMDDIRVYDRVLTQAEITHLAESRGIEGPPPVGLGDEKLWLCPSINDSANDISGNGNNGVYQNGMGTVTDTAEGGSLAYDNNSTNQFVKVSGTIGTTFVSTSLWVKRTAIENTTTWFCGTNAYSPPLWSDSFFSYNGLDYARAGDVQIGVPTALPSSGVWFHLCTVSNGGTTDIYVDGVLHDSVSTASPTATTKEFYLGSSASTTVTSSKYYDDIRVYDRALTQTEITHLASQRGVTGKPPVGLGDEQLWLCPSLNDSANDLSGNNRNGVYSGGMGTVTDTGSGGSFAYHNNSNNQFVKVSGTIGTTFVSTAMWVKRTALENTTLWFCGANVWSGALWSDALWTYSSANWLRAGDVSAANSFALPFGVDWVHLCTVSNGGTTDVYVDGVLHVSQPTASPSATTEAFHLGSSDNPYTITGSRYFDDIRVYDRVLTQAEITHLAEARGIEGPPPVGLGDEKLWLCPSLNDSANDISGNGNNGVYQNGMGTTTDTSNGGSLAYDFDGVGDYIDIASSGISTPTSAYSISVWVNPSVTTLFHVFIAGQTNGFRFANLGNNNANGNILCGQSNDWLQAGSYDLNQWQCVCYTYDGTTVSLYKNGALIGSRTDAPVSYVEQLVRMGADVSGGNLLGGKTDDLRTYDRVLTQAEITHLAEARGIEGPPPVGLGDEQLWLCPSLNDSANDISGNGNNGIYQGGMGTVTDTSNGGSLAYDFDGADDYISNSSLDLRNLPAMSWSAWVKDDKTSGHSSFFSHGLNGQYSNDTYFFQTAGNNSLQVNQSSDGTGSATSPTSSTWNHLAAVFDGSGATNSGRLRYFVNGVEVALSYDYTVPATTGNPSSSSTRIGDYVSAAGFNLFAGQQDDIRVYDRALTPSEITHLASQRGVLGTPPEGLGDELAWVCPTLNSGGTADLSGNGYNGTLEAGASVVSDTGEGGTEALSLTGSVGGCMTLDSSVLPLIQDGRSLTYSCWYKALAADDEMVGFSTRGGGSNGWYVARQVTASGTAVVLIAKAGSTTATCAVAGAGFAGWMHLAWTIDSSGVFTGYQDGVATLVGSIGVAGVSGLTAYIGTNQQAFAAPHYQDDCRLYDRVLTQAEITHLATSRGIEGSPSAATFNPFEASRFNNQFFNSDKT